MAAVLVTSTARLPNNSILVKSGIVKPWDTAAPTSIIADEAVAANNLSYRMDLNMLESYFQTLNKQLYDQKCAAALNVSEQTYRQELAKRQELMTKVDSCMGDINMIRDFIFNEGHSALAHNDRLHLLRSEIETLKMQFRRLELQNAESLELFSRMKMNEQRVLQVEAEMKDMKKNDISESLRLDLENLRNQCEGKFDKWDQYKTHHIETKFHDLQHTIQDQVEERLKSLEGRVETVTEDFNAIFEDAANEQAEKDAMLNNILNGALNPVNDISPSGLIPAINDNNSNEENTTEKSDDNASHISADVDTAHNTGDHVTHHHTNDTTRSDILHRHTIIKGNTTNKSNSSRVTSDDEDEHDVFHSSPPPMLSSQDSSNVSNKINIQTSSSRNINNIPGHLNSNQANASYSRRSSRVLLKRGMSSLGSAEVGISNEEYKGILTAMGKLQAMIQTVQSNVHRIHALQLKFVFEKWLAANILDKKKTAFQQIKAYGDRVHQLKVQSILRRWAKFSNPLQRIMHCFRLKESLYQWKRNVDRINRGTKLRVWLKQKILPWYQRAQPNLSTYIEKWKAFIIFSYRVQNLDRPASTSSSKFGYHRINPEEEEEEIRQLAIQNFDHTQYLNKNFTIMNLKQMALNELHKKWSEEEAQSKEMEKWDTLQQKFEMQFSTWREQITNTTETRHSQLSQKMLTFEKEYAFVTTDLRKTLTTYEENQKMMLARSEGNYQALLGEMSQVQSQLMVKFTAVTDALKDECHRLEKFIDQEIMTRIHQVQGESLAKDMELQQLLQQLSEHNQWKFDTLTSKNSQQDALLETHRQQLSSHAEQLQFDNAKLIHHTEEIQQVKKTIKELSLFYDDEVNWLKQVAKESSRTFTEFKESYEKQLSETQGLLEALMSEEGSEERYTKMLTTMSSLLLKADKWYDKAALVSLQYVNSHKGQSSDGTAGKVKQQYEHLFHRVRGELAAQLSRVARRIAAFIALKSEEELVMFYVEKYMLQHRHDTFYHQTNHNNKSTMNNLFDMSSSAKVVTKIDEIRGRYLVQLQRELEMTFSNVENVTQIRPTTAGNKVFVTTAAGLSATAAERQHRRQLLTTQFLLTVRQCLLAYPAVTTIAGLDSLLKTKAMQLLQQSGNNNTAPTFHNNNVHINIFPNNHNVDHTKVNHVALVTTGKDAGQGGWEDTCLACHRPIVPAQYATAYPEDINVPTTNTNVLNSSFPMNITIPTFNNETTMMSMGMDSIIGEQSLHLQGGGKSNSVRAPAAMLANANSGSIIIPTVKSAGTSPISSPKRMKNAVHSHSLASFHPHISSSTMPSQAFPFKEEHYPESIVELSPGARDRLRRNETKKRRSDRPFSAPADYLEHHDLSVKNNNIDTFRRKHMHINTSARGFGDDSRLYTPQQQAKVISEFLQTQLHRHMSLSIAAGVSMWLSMMLLMISMMTHVEEEKALVKYLIHLKDHVADAAEKENLQNILDVVQSNRSSPTHSISVSPFRKQHSRIIHRWNNENEKIVEELAKATINVDQDVPPDIATATTVSSILPDNSTVLGGDKAPPSFQHSWQEGFDEEVHEDQFAHDHDYHKNFPGQAQAHGLENEHETATLVAEDGSSAVDYSQSQSLALESRGGFHH